MAIIFTILPLFLIIYLNNFLPINCEDKLRYVHAVWRHGDRAPIEKPFAWDKYDESYWPRGWSQLTTVGMQQMQELGQFLRDRYVGKFLTDGFDRKEVHVRSTEVDRAIESAQSLLSGMFPPNSSEKFKEDFAWQPIAIHTAGSLKGDVLTHPWSYHCHRYRQLLGPIRNESDQKLLDKYADLVEFVRPFLNITEGKPVKMKKLMKLRHIMPEIYHNLTQPEWVNKRWAQYGNRTTMDVIWEIRALNWIPDFNGNEEITKLIGGVLLGDLMGRMRSVAKGAQQKVSPASKMVLYSAHDNTLLVLLSALKIGQPENILALPPYASCIIVELYEAEEENNESNGEAKYYLKILYRRNRQLEELILDGCTANCSLKEVVELTKPRAIYGGVEELRELCGVDDDDESTNSSTKGKEWKLFSLISISLSILFAIFIL